MLNKWHWGRIDTVWTCFFCGFPNKDRHEMCERCGCERRGKEVEKTYKTSEMIAMLEENPKLKFRRPCFKPEIYVTVCAGEVCNQGGYHNYKIIHCGKVIDDWQLIRTPVTWQEALQALIEGRTVLCQCADCTGKVMHKDENRARECSFPTGGAICITALKTGTWYIE